MDLRSTTLQEKNKNLLTSDLSNKKELKGGEKEPKNEQNYTVDWIKTHISVWNRVLSSFKGKPGVCMLEVGSYEGRSSVWFLENILTKKDSSIVCIDPWNYGSSVGQKSGIESRFDHNTLLTGSQKKVQKIKGYSHEEIPKLTQKKFDIIYIDGNHESWACMTDICFAWPLLKMGGILIIDDYLWKREGLKEYECPKIAIKAFLEMYIYKYNLLHMDYQVVVEKTTDNCMPPYAKA